RRREDVRVRAEAEVPDQGQDAADGGLRVLHAGEPGGGAAGGADRGGQVTAPARGLSGRGRSRRLQPAAGRPQAEPAATAPDIPLAGGVSRSPHPCRQLPVAHLLGKWKRASTRIAASWGQTLTQEGTCPGS